MANAEVKSVIRDFCPYCNSPYKLEIETSLKKDGLTSYLARVHESCSEFLMFIDTNGLVRGYQTIDSKQSKNNTIDINSYVQLFEDEENTSLFYHIQDIQQEQKFSPESGVLTSKQVKYHNFLRSPYYKEWLRRFYNEKLEFAFDFTGEIILATVNLYDMIRFSVGFATIDLQTDAKIETFNDWVQYIKQKVVTLGEKLLS